MKNMRKMLNDEKGVEGLPVRLIVVLVVGVIALAAIVAMLGTVKPQKSMTATVMTIQSNPGNTLTITATGAEEKKIASYNCIVRVTDTKDGGPVSGASVVIYGLGSAASGTTGSDGNATISSTSGATLNENQNSGYLTLEANTAGYSNFKNENAIVVVRVKQ